MAESSGRNADGAPQVGYRAYLIKDGGKIVLALPALEYDPNAPVITELQSEGVAAVFDQFEHATLNGTKDAVVVNYDPLRTKQNTGGHGKAGASGMGGGPAGTGDGSHNP